jgi:general secretion pathway protein A
MYEGFYGFSEDPFSFGPDPRFLCLTPSHAEAYSGMLSGIRERKGLTVITGDPGIGKTTLVRALLAELDEKVRTAFIVFTLMEFGDLLKSILHGLGIPTEGEDTPALLEMFYRYLSERPEGETVAIIIDEAQGLDVNVLNDLMRLWNAPDPCSPLQTVLIGQPELEEKLDLQEMRGLRDKIAFRHRVRALTRQESSVYIDHRLRIVGSSSAAVFKPGAVRRICDGAAGNPRVINMVCDAVLLIGHSRQRRKINAKIVNEAIEGLRLSPPREARRTFPAEGNKEPTSGPVSAPRPRWGPVYQLVAVSALVAVALVLFVVATFEPVPLKGTKGEAIGTIIPEKGSTLSLPEEQNQGFAPLPGISVKRKPPQRQARTQRKPPQLHGHNQKEPVHPVLHTREPPQHPLAHNKEQPYQPVAPYRPSSADPDALLLKQDPAWRILGR